MLKKIESLRAKPKEVRNLYAFWCAFGFTTIIAVFWLVSVPSRLGILTSAEVTPEKDIEGGLSRTFSDLRASVADGVSLFNTIREETTAEEEVLVEPKKDIDFTTFFSTSSPPVAVDKRQGKTVLIGTTSRAQSTSTDD